MADTFVEDLIEAPFIKEKSKRSSSIEKENANHSSSFENGDDSLLLHVKKQISPFPTTKSTEKETKKRKSSHHHDSAEKKRDKRHHHDGKKKLSRSKSRSRSPDRRHRSSKRRSRSKTSDRKKAAKKSSRKASHSRSLSPSPAKKKETSSLSDKKSKRRSRDETPKSSKKDHKKDRDSSVKNTPQTDAKKSADLDTEIIVDKSDTQMNGLSSFGDYIKSEMVKIDATKTETEKSADLDEKPNEKRAKTVKSHCEERKSKKEEKQLGKNLNSRSRSKSTSSTSSSASSTSSSSKRNKKVKKRDSRSPSATRKTADRRHHHGNERRSSKRRSSRDRKRESSTSRRHHRHRSPSADRHRHRRKRSPSSSSRQRRRHRSSRDKSRSPRQRSRRSRDDNHHDDDRGTRDMTKRYIDERTGKSVSPPPRRGVTDINAPPSVNNPSAVTQPPNNTSEEDTLTPEERDQRTVLFMQLGPYVDERDIMDFLRAHGKRTRDVRDIRLIVDSRTRRSKGLAYVEFRDPDSVAFATTLLNGQKLRGRPIIVQHSQAEKNRIAASLVAGFPTQTGSLQYDSLVINNSIGGALNAGGVQSAGGPKQPTPLKLYVGTLHPEITEDMLKAIFEPFGKIDYITLIMDHETRKSRGYGYIQFHDSEDAKRALESLDGFELAGKAMRVSTHDSEQVNTSSAKAEKSPEETRNSSRDSKKTSKKDNKESHENSNNQQQFNPFPPIPVPAVVSLPNLIGGLAGLNTNDLVNYTGGRHLTASINQSGTAYSILDSEETEKRGIDIGTTGRIQLMAKLAQGTGLQLPKAAHDVLKSAASAVSHPAIAKQLTPPVTEPPIATSAFMLSNMFDPSQESGDDWTADIRDDVIEECEKYGGGGGVLHCHVDAQSAAGSVYVKCTDVATAQFAVTALHGRFFAGKMITAAYVPLTNYHNLFPESVTANLRLKPHSLKV